SGYSCGRAPAPLLRPAQDTPCLTCGERFLTTAAWPGRCQFKRPDDATREKLFKQFAGNCRTATAPCTRSHPLLRCRLMRYQLLIAMTLFVVGCAKRDPTGERPPDAKQQGRKLTDDEARLVGEYYEGDGTGYNLTLTLGPDGSFDGE